MKVFVALRESFEVSLGVDPSVKIGYGASEEFHEETGQIIKWRLRTHLQRIALNNTKAEDVTLKIQESLPLSTDSTLKMGLNFKIKN